MATTQTARTTILTTPEFKAWLSTEAKKEGLSVSELVRQRCQPQPEFTEKEEFLLSALADEMEKSNQEAVEVFNQAMTELKSVLAELRKAKKKGVKQKMGTVDRIFEAAKQSMLINERMKIMAEGIKETTSELRDQAKELRDHEKRLIRIETFIELAGDMQKRLTD